MAARCESCGNVQLDEETLQAQGQHTAPVYDRELRAQVVRLDTELRLLESTRSVGSDHTGELSSPVKGGTA